MMNKYGIIGLGWLGLELAKALQLENCQVWGTSTSLEKTLQLKQQGFNASYFQIQEEGCKGSIEELLQETTHLFFNIPPGLRKNTQTNYVKKIDNFIDLLENTTLKQLTYVSSTSVFEEEVGIPEYSEISLPNSSTPSGKQLITAEKHIQELKIPTVQVLRLGGLIGGERHPAKYLSGKTDLSSPQAPVNLVSREDAVQLSKRLLRHAKSGIFHGVYPNYPTRRVFYTQACKQMKLQGVGFNDLDTNKGKKISSLKTSNELNFNFEKQP